MLRVLIVDDSKSFVNHTVEYLRRYGWEAEAAFDGRQAIEVLSSGRPFDGVLLDRSMPGLPGDEVLRWIRVEGMKDPHLRSRLHHLCVVMLTAYGDVQNAVEALKLGAFQYLQKPIEEPSHLRSILAAGIAWQRAHAMRRELLVTRDRKELFAKVRGILEDSVRPEGVHIMLINQDGSIDEIVGSDIHVDRGGVRRFVQRLMAGEQLVFEHSDQDVVTLDPILPGAKTLMAVPVRGSQRPMVGALVMESTSERAFDPSWGEVLSYFADLIGIALEIETQIAEKIRIEVNAEREKVKQLGLVYRELRHHIATEAQIVSMQAREVLETDLAPPVTDRELRIRQRVSLIQRNIDKIEGVVQNIKAISLQPAEPKIESVHVETIVRESIEAYRPRLVSGIDLTVDNKMPGLTIHADRTNLTYCLQCLIQNSIEAIEEARRSRPDQTEGASDRIELHVGEENGNVRIMVRDSGVGFEVPEQVLFQPLFSSKTRPPMTGEQQDVTGADRVVRILEVIGKWVIDRLNVGRLESIRKGVDILIRDGDAVTVSIRQGPASGDLTIAEFEQTADETVATYRALSGDWPHGMGLYSVRRIVEEMHGGKLTAASAGFGKGASFTMLLPKLL